MQLLGNNAGSYSIKCIHPLQDVEQHVLGQPAQPVFVGGCLLQLI
jgi:hypothetical protein